MVAIADTKSFTAAAEELGISQSSLSHAIAGLEQELGICLLDRGRQGAEPTEVGYRVLVHAREVLSRFDSIRLEADNNIGLLSGRLRIGSVPSATAAFLPKVIAQFGRQYPHIEIVLLEDPSQEDKQLHDWLRDHTIDIALLELPRVGLKTVPLMKDELCAIVPATSELAGRRRISIRELAKEPFVMSRYTSEPLVRSAFAQQNLSARIRFEVQDLGTLVSMVREGLGLSIVPRLAFSAIPDGVALVSVAPAIRRELGFAMKSSDHLPPAALAFIRKAKELAQYPDAAF
jgi:DNA-binding transcriptional LysR family regulator